MKKIILFFMVGILFLSQESFTQTILSAGDIAIVGLNCDNPDDFAFVLLTNIDTNTVINFTDNGWLNTGVFRTGEGTIKYTAPSNLTAGTVIIRSVNTTNFSNVSGSFDLSASGDQIIAFQGNATSPILLYALNDDSTGVWQANATSSNTSALPAGLVNGTSAVAINEFDNAYYNVGADPDLNSLRNKIGNNANWTGNDTTRYDFTSVISNPLPVELTSFAANILSSGVELKWQTATEVNNFGFDVERSIDNQNWTKIGFVAGNGNSNSPKDYSYVDEDIKNQANGKYYYHLKQIDTDGSYEYSETIEVNWTSGVTDVNDSKSLPNEFALSQNYPNPFNPSTVIKYTITASPISSPKERTFVRLVVYDILGNEISTLVNEEKPAGEYEVEFNGKGLSSGMYFYKIEAGNFVQVKKMIMLK
ncbi:MAG: hypothetical protein STSR0008_23320 [Ignavibacterium sp.]